MPKVVLEFNLPEEEQQFRAAVDGGKWQVVVTDMDEWLRQKCKYAESDVLTAGEARDKLRELASEAGMELF